MLSREQFVRQTGECEEIVARIRPLSRQEFAAGVCRRHRARIAFLCDLGAGGAKVEYACLAGVGDHDVLRLQVAVHHVARMCVRDGGRHLEDDCPSS